MATQLKSVVTLALVLAVVAVARQAQAGGCYHGHCYTPRPVYVQPYCVKPVYPRPVVVARPVVRPVVKPVVAGLSLVDVRFVDPGSPAQQLGPRFRIVLRNNGPLAIRRPIDLVLAAGIDRRLIANLPQSSERISLLAPGQVLPIDIRLPIESMAMAHPGEAKPAPFSMLFVMLAGQRDLQGAPALKQLAVLPRINILPVDLDLLTPANSAAPLGSTITLRGEGFGIIPGRVILSLPGLELNTKVVNWSPLGVQVELPKLALATPALAKLIVIRNDDMQRVLPIKATPPVFVVPAAPAAVAAPAPVAAPAAVEAPAAGPVDANAIPASAAPADARDPFAAGLGPIRSNSGLPGQQ